MLAHELRNPLAPISSSASVLGLLFADEPRVRQTSAIISRQVGHMTRLIDDLLDVSRVTRGLISLNVEPLDLRDIVSGALDQTRPLIDEKRQQVQIDMPAAPVHVAGDRTRLVQVVANILNNAAKYTPESGTIDVALDVAEQAAQLVVQDNGAGMPPELVPNVFDLFTQGARTLARSQGGLGLGLTLVKRLVELHGGDVMAYSEGINQGSRITVHLPYRERPDTTAADDGDERQACSESKPAATRAPLNLMVVDDNQDAADTMAAWLHTQGYLVTVEYGSERALQRAAAAPPDAMLIDIGLPGMDGYELAQRLQALPQTAAVKLIAVTGYGQARDRDQAQTAGFACHLVKPVDAAALNDALAGLVPDQPATT
jgi:CheY-like chemotaxis protein